MFGHLGGSDTSTAWETEMWKNLPIVKYRKIARIRQITLASGCVNIRRCLNMAKLEKLY